MTIEQVTAEVAANIHCDEGGSCLVFTELATQALVQHGFNNFVVVEGWVKAQNESHWRQHSWLEIDGVRIDPTFVQFAHLGKVKYVNRIKQRLSPQAYLVLCEQFPFAKHDPDWQARYLKNSLEGVSRQ